jgi:hypothetical protein
MSEKSKRKRTPITPLERFNMIAAFVICLVVGFVVFQMLVLTGYFCVLLPVIGMGICVLGMTVMEKDPSEKEKSQTNITLEEPLNMPADEKQTRDMQR